MPEAAVAMPLFFGLLFVWQDMMVLGYHWVAMQWVAKSTAQQSLIGIPYDTNSANDVGDRATALTNAQTSASNLAAMVGINGGNLFRMNGSTLYTEDTTHGTNYWWNATASLLTNPSPISPATATSFFGGDNGISHSYISVSLTHRVRLNPVSSFLMSVSGSADGIVTLRASAVARLEYWG